MYFLSRGRKFKGSLVAAVQSLAQLESVYGPKDSEVLMGLFGTWLQYRVGDMYSAEKVSHILGHQEALRHQEWISYGASDTRDGVSIQQQRQHEALVIPTEIMKLRDMEAFLKIPGHFPITKIKLNYQK
jgi:type IV secretory pathway TraG/TraD family ATPase VirD4